MHSAKQVYFWPFTLEPSTKKAAMQKQLTTMIDYLFSLSKKLRQLLPSVTPWVYGATVRKWLCGKAPLEVCLQNCFWVSDSGVKYPLPEPSHIQQSNDEQIQQGQEWWKIDQWAWRYIEEATSSILQLDPYNSGFCGGCSMSLADIPHRRRSEERGMRKATEALSMDPAAVQLSLDGHVSTRLWNSMIFTESRDGTTPAIFSIAAEDGDTCMVQRQVSHYMSLAPWWVANGSVSPSKCIFRIDYVE